MLVYRITLAKFSTALCPSGIAARWNPNDAKMIYTASSRALACLENLVHRGSVGLAAQFRTMVIEIPDRLAVATIENKELKTGWKSFENYPYTQALGEAWIKEAKTAILKVPSAIISEECNYLLNPSHKDFTKIELVRVEDFEFYGRIKK